MKGLEVQKYLGSIIQWKENIDEDINHRIKVGRQKWKNAGDVLCDKRMPATVRLKGKVYPMVVRPVVLYGFECWSIKKIQLQRLMVGEMRMIR